MKHFLFPGSFDPMTRAHLDLALRAAKLCDHLTVAVLQNRDKAAGRSLDVRLAMLEKIFSGYPNISVVGYAGALVDLAQEIGATALVRGLRNSEDLEYEFPWARLHWEQMGVETLFLAPVARDTDLSSSMVRQWAGLGKDVSSMVPEVILEDVKALYGPKN